MAGRSLSVLPLSIMSPRCSQMPPSSDLLSLTVPVAVAEAHAFSTIQKRLVAYQHRSHGAPTWGEAIYGLGKGMKRLSVSRASLGCRKAGWIGCGTDRYVQRLVSRWIGRAQSSQIVEKVKVAQDGKKNTLKTAIVEMLQRCRVMLGSAARGRKLREVEDKVRTTASGRSGLTKAGRR
ncbi:hypothetical protein GE09DRAFT_42916 [Coniochaeta sp. 2T2.1]|nr:hypothetical protein GE09DRAFT_42916 [Coniochaeta sp. 2T2.1]